MRRRLAGGRDGPAQNACPGRGWRGILDVFMRRHRLAVVEYGMRRGATDWGRTMTNGSVFVVDDDQSMRQAIERLLKSARFKTRLFPSANAFLEQFDPRVFGCLVLDLRMPGMTGMELLQRIADTDHQLAVLVITAFGDVPTAVRAMRLGATDFLEKPFNPPEFVEHVRQAVERAADLNRQYQARQNALARFNALSPRERDVLNMLLAGMSNKQVASNLVVSEKTISAHRSHILEKTGADSLISLVHLLGLAGIECRQVPRRRCFKSSSAAPADLPEGHCFDDDLGHDDEED